MPEPITRINQELKDKADLLVQILRGRVQSFMNRRHVPKERENHWAIKLAYKNLSMVAAYMVLADHVKDNLKCLDATKSLLTPNTNKFHPANAFKDEIGAYLFNDTNLGEIIRTGSNSGQGFAGRYNDHRLNAMKTGLPESDFYLYYPTKDNPRATSKAVRGNFESLEQIIAAGFDPKCDLSKCIDKSYEEGGVLIMSKADKTKINSSIRQNPNSLHKFHAFLCYQMEYGYDLAISPASNVSGSFGFEQFVGLMR
jgi:hypothetical protein